MYDDTFNEKQQLQVEVSKNHQLESSVKDLRFDQDIQLEANQKLKEMVKKQTEMYSIKFKEIELKYLKTMTQSQESMNEL